ncbi:3-keto-5-aminohexanoate cleavage protein [Mesorhizobium sp. VK25A]|uniref:3-keto-5-aminohexanoate cleavage protein n=1 Tax=Mesorhizobium vachelliae TaxID=3072309 RepID=A0ABU5ACP3_9HYPH|nr:MULTISPECIES: 3-keto-5-aminohexanoate cleavage protein [unclassified Mesorhizobium]MDX8534206.1 3-keto-5-aminohexanoate cleavage protein [Mesorhizobium sp. VK25D]MDX8546775.1 3-keto-5-aminohexanoate cleavage protein [Mesorhizobium sp. VK25A]
MTVDPLLIMVAPNGARRTKNDHPALPMTAPELAETAAACLAEGAAAMHVHVRDEAGAHALDADLYTEALAAIRERTNGRMLVQVTTEAVGRYSPLEQMQLVRALRPVAVSVALREILRAGEAAASAFFAWTAEQGIGVQHILYDDVDLDKFVQLFRRGDFGDMRQPRLLFVLGRYARDQESRPEDLDSFLAGLERHGLVVGTTWSVCAFGRGETAALAAAIARGGHVRVGFENSLWNADGAMARDNAERVAAIARVADNAGRPLASAQQARAILGIA